MSETPEKTEIKEEESENNIQKKENTPVTKIDILDILKLVSPGTPLRIAIDDITRAKTGALVVIMSSNLHGILEGGFKVNCKFFPQRLIELSKMDGAVILSEDLEEILYSNVLLIPNPKISSSETGTRHKAAERTAKQANTLVIAISQRRDRVTLYYCDTKYVLRDADEILRRATETLQILEKQREIYDDLITNLNVLEVTGLVSFSDVCNLLQRTEMIIRIGELIRKSIIELGKEGNIVKMRLRELTKNVERTEQMILKDYSNKPERIKELISGISFDDLIDTEGISKLLFNKASNEMIQPKGYRLLSRTNLAEADLHNFIEGFKNLNNILNLSIEDIKNVLKDKDFSQEFQKEVKNLRENIMVGKKI
jgi:diadenylate cyclase